MQQSLQILSIKPMERQKDLKGNVFRCTESYYVALLSHSHGVAVGLPRPGRHLDLMPLFSFSIRAAFKGYRIPGIFSVFCSRLEK